MTLIGRQTVLASIGESRHVSPWDHRRVVPVGMNDDRALALGPGRSGCRSG